MSGLFSSPSIPPPPAPTPPPPMPDPNGPASMEAARLAAVKASAGGRSSTILTAAGNRASSTIAGGSSGIAYSNSTLGGAR